MSFEQQSATGGRNELPVKNFADHALERKQELASEISGVNEEIAKLELAAGSTLGRIRLLFESDHLDALYKKHTALHEDWRRLGFGEEDLPYQSKH